VCTLPQLLLLPLLLLDVQSFYRQFCLLFGALKQTVCGPHLSLSLPLQQKKILKTKYIFIYIEIIDQVSSELKRNSSTKIDGKSKRKKKGTQNKTKNQ